MDSDDEILGLVTQAVGSAGVDQGDVEPEQCELCKVSVPDGQLSNWPMMGYKVLDKGCFNALKALYRALQGKPALRRALEKMQEQEHFKFQSLVISLKTPERNKKRSNKLTAAIECIDILASEHSKRRKYSTLLFTKRQWVAWHKLHEDMTKEEAEQFWQEEKHNPDTYQEQNRKNELTIACEMPVELSKADTKIERKERRTLIPDKNIYGKRIPGVDRDFRRHVRGRRSCSPHRGPGRVASPTENGSRSDSEPAPRRPSRSSASPAPKRVDRKPNAKSPSPPRSASKGQRQPLSQQAAHGNTSSFRKRSTLSPATTLRMANQADESPGLSAGSTGFLEAAGGLHMFQKCVGIEIVEFGHCLCLLTFAAVRLQACSYKYKSTSRKG